MTTAGFVETEPAWGQAESLYQPTRPAFWLFVALFVAGSVLLSQRVSPALGVDVGSMSLAVVLWTLYAAPFVVLIAALDLLEPEPPAFLAAAFAWGSVVAVSIAVVANSASQSVFAKTFGIDFTRRWWPSLSGATTEETLKAVGLVVIVLIARSQVNTLLDGLVYGLFVGLGFQVSENVLYTSDRLQTAVFSATPGRMVLDLFVLRGLALGLWSHAVYTAIVGVGIAYAVIATDRPRARRVAIPMLLFGVAWSLHFLWNAPFLQPRHGTSFAFSDLGLYVAKGVPALLLVVALYVIAHRREVAWFVETLHDDPDVRPEELQALSTRAGRRRERAASRERGGRPAALTMRRLQRAQVRLAVALVRSAGAHTAAVDAARREIRDERSRLVH